MIKTLTAALALTAIASFAIAAEPTKMTDAALDTVVAGCDCPEVDVKGNNGWGNGSDPSNAGSDAGLTSLSKLANDNIAGATGVNLNPTTSTGR